ncbi:MAG: GNAT family N-acetyltransferase, partial [Thermomicrobiales bacterium]
MWKGILAGKNLPIHVWVAEEQGHVVGFCSIGPSRDQSLQPGVLELYTIYLFPNSARQGIGSLLIDAVVRFAREEGIGQ